MCSFVDCSFLLNYVSLHSKRVCVWRGDVCGGWEVPSKKALCVYNPSLYGLQPVEIGIPERKSLKREKDVHIRKWKKKFHSRLKWKNWSHG